MKKIFSLFAILAFLVSCNNSSQNGKVSITAAGATFPLPYYNMAFKNYTSESGTLLPMVESGPAVESEAWVIRSLISVPQMPTLQMRNLQICLLK